MSIRLFRRPAALICSLALLLARSPAALAAGTPAVSDKKICPNPAFRQFSNKA